MKDLHFLITGYGDMASRSYWTKHRRKLRILESLDSSSSVQEINESDIFGEVNPESNLFLDVNNGEEEVFTDCLKFIW